MDLEFNKRYWFLAAAFLLFCLLLTPLGNFNNWIPPTAHTGFYSLNNIDPGDDTGYYAYLRSAFFDGDLDFINERNYAHREKFLPTGYVFNNWQIGQSVLFLPFFLVGHFIALLLNAFGFAISTDGYSSPYYISTAIASHTYLFLGLLQLSKILKRFTTEQIALWVVILIWLCSPLVYFSFIRQRMAHTTEFFMAVMLLSAWLQTRESEKQVDHAFLGIILGLFCMVRVINVVFFALYFFDQIILKKPSALKNNKPLLKAFLSRSFWTLLCFLIALSPQLLMWQKLNGVPLPIRHFEMAGAGITHILTLKLFSKLYNVFFSPQWGIFFSFPISIISTIGLFLEKQLKPIRWGIVAYLIAIVCVIAIYPESSDSYGERHFISSIPLLAVGLAGIFNWAFQAKNKIFLFITSSLIGVCFLIQYCMVVQYKIIILPEDPKFTYKAITYIPKLLFEYPENLSRSSNWFRLLTISRETPWNIKDFLYMVVFPLAQLGVLILVYFSFHRLSSLREESKKLITQNSFLTASGSLIVLLILLIIVLAPTKNQTEIEKRHQYAELIKEGKAYQQKNQFNRAINYFKKAIDKELPSLTPYMNLGRIYKSKNNLHESNKNFEKVLNLNPNHQGALIHLAENSELLGHYEKAENYLQTAKEINSTKVEVYDLLGQVYAKQKRPNDSEKMFKTAISLKPNYANGHLNLAILYTQLGKKEDAIHHLKETVRLGVRNQTVTNLLNSYGISPRKTP